MAGRFLVCLKQFQLKVNQHLNVKVKVYNTAVNHGNNTHASGCKRQNGLPGVQIQKIVTENESVKFVTLVITR